MKKTQKSQKPKNKTEKTQTNPLEFKIDPSELGLDRLYPCCLDGNCSLYFYWEEEWRKQEENQKKQKTKQETTKTNPTRRKK